MADHLRDRGHHSCKPHHWDAESRFLSGTQTVVVRFSPPIWVAYSPVCPISWWRSWCPVLSLWTTTTSRPPPFELVVCFRLLAVLLLEVQNPPLLAEPVLGVLLDVDSTDLECDAKRCWGLGGATRPPLWMLPENLETSLDHDRSCRYCGAANGDVLRWGCSETIFEFWIPNSCETSSTISDQSSKSSLVSVPKFQPVTSVLSVIDNWTRVSPQQLLQGWTPMQDNNKSVVDELKGQLKWVRATNDARHRPVEMD